MLERRIGRRAVLAGALGAAIAPSVPVGAAGALETPPIVSRPALRAPRFAQFGIDESAVAHIRMAVVGGAIQGASVLDLQVAMESGQFTSGDLAAWCIERIRRFDAGRLQSVVELNPDALAIAAALDGERSSGRTRGPLHGIPVLLKDNIGTGDELHTTAGAAALISARCDRDALLVAALRQSGALILGKTNMSEWSYWMAWYAPSGYSAVGGQTLSPWGTGIDPFGSSTGSAVAVAAGFAPLAVGTETVGSIIAPAARASVVGVRPTLGLVSRDRIIPISDELDSAGPIARTVADAAALLTAMATPIDLADRAMPAAAGLHGTDFVARLDRSALRGSCIGVVCDGPEAALPDDRAVAFLGLEPAAAAMRRLGARVRVLRTAPFGVTYQSFDLPASWAMGRGVDAYLQATRAPAPSVADIIAFNETQPARYAPFGQQRLYECIASPLSEAEARNAAAGLRQSARHWLDQLLDEGDCDAVVGVDNLQSLAYPTAGYPAVTVPLGASVAGYPFGATFIGRRRDDARLLALAYAFEQATRWRIVPDLNLPGA
jgi:amidase